MRNHCPALSSLRQRAGGTAGPVGVHHAEALGCLHPTLLTDHRPVGP